MDVAETILACVLTVALLWFLQSAYNPLWDIWARWPRSIEASHLDAKFEGLIRFGQPGAGILLISVAASDSVAFQKASPPGSSEFHLTIKPETEVGERAALSLGGEDHLQVCPDQPGFLVSCSEPARLEAFTREVLRSLRHSPDERYSVVFHGPTDAEAINEYYGLR